MNKAMHERLRQPNSDIAVNDTPEQTFLPSGFAELDRILPGGGWPENALTELLHDQSGSTDLRLLLPALAQLSRSDRWIACIAPPHAIDASTLAAQGVDLSRILLVHPRAHHSVNSLRVIERALRGGKCSAVLAWPEQVDDGQLQRLQRAAETSGTWCILFRKPAAVRQPSPTALQLHLGQDAQGTLITVLAYRGERQHQRLRLDLDRPRVRALPFHAITRTSFVEEGPTMKQPRNNLARRTVPDRHHFPQMSLPLDTPEEPGTEQQVKHSPVAEEPASPYQKGVHHRA